MKYKLGLAVKDHRGEQMTEGEGENKINLTLGHLLERACIFGGKPDLSADDKFRQFKLAQRIARGTSPLANPVEFSAAEVDTLKKLCGQVYSPIAYGAVCDMLENEQFIERVIPLPAEVERVIGARGPTAVESLIGDANGAVDSQHEV